MSDAKVTQCTIIINSVHFQTLPYFLLKLTGLDIFNKNDTQFLLNENGKTS